MLVFSVTLTALLALLGPQVSAQSCESITLTDLAISETVEEGYFEVLDGSGIFTGRGCLKGIFLSKMLSETQAGGQGDPGGGIHATS